MYLELLSHSEKITIGRIYIYVEIFLEQALYILLHLHVRYNVSDNNLVCIDI